MWRFYTSGGAEKIADSASLGSVKLYDQTLTADTASIDTGAVIPSGYDVLEIWVIARTDDVAALATIGFRVNNDSGSTYDREVLTGNNVTVTSASSLAQTQWLRNCHGAGGSTDYASIFRITIPGYTDSTFNKVGEMSELVMDATAGTDLIGINAIGWRNIGAISRFAVLAQGTAKLKSGSRLMIFGRGNVSRVAGAQIAAGLPAHPTNGDTVQLRAGNSPYEYVSLVYDSVLAKWVSPRIEGPHATTTASFTTASTTYTNAASVTPWTVIPNYLDLFNAGLRLQVWCQADMKNSSGANTTFFALQLYGQADGDTAFTQLGSTVGGEISIATATSTLKMSGWQDFNPATPTKQHATLLPAMKVSAGTGTYDSLDLFQSFYRWVA